MKMTIVLDSDDVEGIAAAARMIEILKMRVGLGTGVRGKVVSRLKLVRLMRDFANMVAFEHGEKYTTDVDYTSLKYIKDFVDKHWVDLE